MSLLFSPLKIKDVEIKNRIMMSPMCQYSAKDGHAKDWHFVHYGTRAVGGAGLIMFEATAVLPKGRITYGDLGLWTEEHAQRLKHITNFIKSQGSVAGIQLAHAGRKASLQLPKDGDGPLRDAEGAWEIVAPSAIPFGNNYQVPTALSICDIHSIEESFANAAQKAFVAGFEVVEIHAAHGYLINEFMSPATNKRTDDYGGSFENRIRFLLEIIDHIKFVWPDNLPIFVRISATDYVDGSWDINQSIMLAKELKKKGIDVIDVSSGGLVPDAKIQYDFGYQLAFAERIHKETGIMTATVGMNTTAEQGEMILRDDMSDIVVYGRELLRDPYFALNAAKVVHDDIEWPVQYIRAKNK